MNNRAAMWWNEEFWSTNGYAEGARGMWSATREIKIPKGMTFTVLQDGPLYMDGFTRPLDAVGCAMAVYMQHGLPVKVVVDVPQGLGPHRKYEDETESIFVVASTQHEVKQWK